MSAANAGRKNIESRLVDHVAVGERILDPNGREYTVIALLPCPPGRVGLSLQPRGQCGNLPVYFDRFEQVRVRR